MCCSRIIATVRRRRVHGWRLPWASLADVSSDPNSPWVGDWASYSASLSPQKGDTICLTHRRFIITYYPTLLLVTDPVENLIAAWREEETFPSKVFPTPLPISLAWNSGLSEPPFLRTKNPGASSGIHTSICRSGRTFQIHWSDDTRDVPP